jgi:hypothetical protein
VSILVKAGFAKINPVACPNCLPEAVLGHDEDCRAYIAAGLDFSRRTGYDVTENFAASRRYGF